MTIWIFQKLKSHYQRFRRWMGWDIDPLTKSMPLSQMDILLHLQRHLVEKSPHLDQLLTAQELYDQLTESSITEDWSSFTSDLETLRTRNLLTWQGEERVLLTMMGSYLAKEYQKKLD